MIKLAADLKISIIAHDLQNNYLSFDNIIFILINNNNKNSHTQLIALHVTIVWF